MGFDIAYHGIKQSAIEEIISYCMGRKDNIDNLIFKIARVRQNRFIANHFGGLISDRLENQKEGSSSPGKPKFNSFLHIWGRPFLVVENNKDKIVEIITQYCNATTDQEVLSIIESQVSLLDKGLFNILCQEGENYTESLPTLDDLTQEYQTMAEEIKKIFQALIKNTIYTDAEGTQDDPKNVLSNPIHIIIFLAMAFPAWMDRGLICCPSMLIENSGLSLPKYAKNPLTLLGNLGREFKINEQEIMPENYSLGSVIFPEDLPEFIAFFNSHIEKFKDLLASEIEDEAEIQLILQKIEEALYFCLKSESIFVESTDIFSGFLGIVT